MKYVAFAGEIKEYQGRTDYKDANGAAIPFPIKYDGKAEQFENIAEVKEAGKWPNDADILEFVNKRMLTAAKAKEYQTKTKDLKAAYEDSPEFKRSELVKAAMAAGFTQAEAEALALSKLPK